MEASTPRPPSRIGYARAKARHSEAAADDRARGLLLTARTIGGADWEGTANNPEVDALTILGETNAQDRERLLALLLPEYLRLRRAQTDERPGG